MGKENWLLGELFGARKFAATVANKPHTMVTEPGYLVFIKVAMVTEPGYLVFIKVAMVTEPGYLVFIKVAMVTGPAI